MSNRVISLRRRGRWAVCATVGVALAGLAAVVSPGWASADATATAPVKLSVAPIGINIPVWDSLYTGSSGATVQALLKKAGVDAIRYGGGTVADEYDWSTDSDIQKCATTAPSGFTAKCATYDALYFSLFSKNARAIHAQSFVTVNYGSGTPALAAAWVKKAKTTAGEQVGLWEVGNENYGCWEANNELAGAPADYKGYKPGVNATCPMVKDGTAAGMKIMTDSYAANSAKFLAAMRAASPSALLGVPYANGADVPGASVADNTEWNNIVLGTDKKYVNFVDEHWYPFTFGGNTGGANPTNEQVLQSLFEIPARYAEIKAELSHYVPKAQVVVGETGITYLATTTACTTTGGLFAAGDVLSWLASGAESADWWQLNSYGNTGSKCTKPDEGIFTSAAKPVPETPYIGLLLASQLAQPGARLQFLTTSDPADVLAFQSVLKDGKVVVGLINTNTVSAEHVTYKSALSGKLGIISYKTVGQNASGTRTTAGATTAAVVAAGTTLPADSMTIFKEG